MPKIRQYEQQTRADGGYPNRPNPHAVASDFGGTGVRELGNALQSAGFDVAAADRALQQQASRLEVTDVHTNRARLLAERTVKMDERLKTVQPGDETFSTAFMEDTGLLIDQTIERYQTAEGRAAAKQMAAELKAHFLERSTMAQAELAGVKFTEDYKAQIDSYQIVVNNRPTDFGLVKQWMEEAYNDPGSSYAKVPAKHRPAVRREGLAGVANAAMEGEIRLGPERAKMVLENPKSDPNNPAQYVTGEQLNALKSKAEAGIERQHSLKERERVANKIKAQDDEDKLESTFIQRILDPKNHGGPPSDTEIAASGMTADGMRTIDGFKAQRLRELEARQEEKTHPAMVRDLLNQMIADGDDPIKSYNLDGAKHAYRKGLISTKEYTFLADRFTRLKDESTNTFEKDLNRMIGVAMQSIANDVRFVSQTGRVVEAVGRIMQDAYAMAERLRKENKNPREMLTDPKGFFSQANIDSYLMTRSQALAAGAQAATVPAVGTIMPSSKGPVRFKGGDQYDKANWEPVEPPPAPVPANARRDENRRP